MEAGILDSIMHATRSKDGSPRVLVVEDERDIAALVAYQLTREGFRVETAHSGDEALAALNRQIPDLVVLDRLLPGISGDDVLKSIRGEPAMQTVPVLMLTAKREREDRIEGLELGADDYLTKPFSPRELVLRVQAVLRRTRGPSVSSGGRVLRAGPLRMDLTAHEVTLGDEAVELTPTEFRLLQVFMEHEGRIQSREQLLQRAWNMEAHAADRVQTRTVDMHVGRLRSKLGDQADCVETVRGFGYRFRAPGPTDEPKSS